MTESAHGASPEVTVAKAPRFIVISALVAVYLIWGSTYLAMRVALETWPPFLMGGLRFSSASAVLMIVLRLRGAPWPTLTEWKATAVVGVLLLTMGNGLVAFAESGKVDSGVAATVVATMPMWMAAISALFGDRPTPRETIGLLLGFAGVLVLQGGGSLHFGEASTWAVLAAPVAWALGSVLARRLPMPKGLTAAGAQMIVGGLVMVAVSVGRGEKLSVAPTLRASLALAYLIIFGSLLAFSAFAYLLRNTRPAVASSYAYVNPLVALGLGALLANETITLGKLAASLVIVLGVVLATGKRASAKSKTGDTLGAPLRSKAP